ncbi:MAG TPA: DUF2470 domain-containing protein [Trebonia sp.]
MNSDLGRLARETVEQASSATLAIRGRPLGPGSALAGVYTDNGWPVLRCDLNSVVAAAAAENLTATLAVRGRADDGPETVTVLLTGTLETIGRARDNGREISAVALMLEHVVIETRTAGCPAVARPVPVSEYTGVDPVTLAACARRLAEHTNASHDGELRRFAASHSGLPAAAVAAAWLTGLDPNGLELGWIGPDGARTVTVSFPRQARTPTELSLLVRRQLCACPPGHDG